MALPFARQTTEELLGMSKEDLVKKLEAAATKDDLTTALKPVEELRGTLDTIKASLAALTTPKETPPENNNDDSDPAVRMLSDPNKFVTDATKDLRNASLETKAQLNEMRARQNPSLAPAFREYGKEIMGMAEKISLEQRAHPGFWEWHIRTVIGDKMIKGELKQGYPSLLGTGSGPRGESGDSDDPNFGFDPDMAAFFKNRGKNLKDMAFLRDNVQRDGELLTQSSWKARPH
jgi:hypothetical protein